MTMATEVNEYVINADEVISRAESRGESELLISKKKEALEQIESLDMPKPDKTKLNSTAQQYACISSSFR